MLTLNIEFPIFSKRCENLIIINLCIYAFIVYFFLTFYLVFLEYLILQLSNLLHIYILYICACIYKHYTRNYVYINMFPFSLLKRKLRMAIQTISHFAIYSNFSAIFQSCHTFPPPFLYILSEPYYVKKYVFSMKYLRRN